MQSRLFREAKTRLDANIVTGVKNFAELSEYFGAGVEEDEGGEFKGWVRAVWSRPEGAALDEIDVKLKKLRLTLRNIPEKQAPASGLCIFTGAAGKEEILIARAY
jgi:prolyl-tRNA synthetase